MIFRKFDKCLQEAWHMFVQKRSIKEQDSKSLPHAKITKNREKVEKNHSTWNVAGIREYQLRVWREICLLSSTPVWIMIALPHQLLKFSPQIHYLFPVPLFFAYVVHSLTFIPDLRATHLRFSKRVSPGLIKRPIHCKN